MITVLSGDWQVRRAYAAAGAIALLFSLSGCAAPSTETDNLTTPPLTTTANVGSNKTAQPLEALKITILPDQSGGDRAVNIAELNTYLSESLNIPIEIDIASDYNNAVERLVSGIANMAYLGPLTYVQAKEQDPTIEPLVAPIDSRTGRPWYTSTIVSTIEIETLEDLQGKRFGFVNNASTSGFLVPRHAFQMMGLNPETDFAEIRYGEAHDKTLQLLLDGEVEAIAIDRSTYRKNVESGVLDPEKYHLIWESEPITNAPIVISKEIPPDLKIELQKALVNAPAGLVSISTDDSAGYTIVQDADYNFVRQLHRSLHTEN
ncbi:MAG: phosphate/phosphite/phosphonate ABC transporter substrate-binding protein [Limnothrix sp.]